MSTLENLRFYADGITVRDREQPNRVLRFGSPWMATSAAETAKLLNEMPEWAPRFLWDELEPEGNAL